MSITPQRRRLKMHLKIYTIRQSDEGLTVETSAYELSTVASLH